MNDKLDINIPYKYYYGYGGDYGKKRELGEERTALHLAVINKNIEIIKMLLSHKGINIYSKDEKGKTPIELTDNKEIIKMFISRVMEVLTPSIISKLMSTKVLIGEGATSTVYRVENYLSGKSYLCLKILKDIFIKKSQNQDASKPDDDDDSYWKEEEDFNDKTNEPIEIDFDIVKSFFMEFEILNKIDHPNIVKTYGFFLGDKDTNPAILIEYCRTNLEKAINRLKDFELVGIIYEICSAMKHVHANKIIHRDLKMSNILINMQKHVKICDFGIAKKVDLTTYSSLTHGVGSLLFMAPELFDENSTYDEKVDVYAFGVVMYFIVTKGQLPKSNPQKGYESFPLPETINKLSQSIIKRCWSSDPQNRQSFEEILNLIVNNNFMLIDGIESKIPQIKEHLGLA